MTEPMRRLAASFAAGLAIVGVPAAAHAQAPEDPALDQTIERDQAVATGTAILDDGHVDIGPRLVDGALTLLVHDDSVIPAVWRNLEDTVIAVGDDAVQTVPDDPTYAFLGADPGTPVHVVPQVQRPGVVWVGWNTQDPAVMEQIDRGATLTLLGVQGPGELTMYLQSGNLSEPEVLWQSATSDRQPVWVEVNTHTHANWVFTEPGAYLVQVEVSADLVGVGTVSDVRTLRFAVGDSTRPEDVLGATYTLDPPPADSATSEGSSATGNVDGGSSSAPVIVGIVAGAVVLAAVVLAVVARGAGAKRRAERERAAEAGSP